MSGWAAIAAPTPWAVAIDEIEDPRGRACRMHDFREDISGERRNLGRLQHHGAAAGERRRDLAQNWLSGQFQGVMKPQTPIGSLTRSVVPRSSSKA